MRVAPCAKCQQVRTVFARQLCAPCYQYERSRGTVGDWDTLKPSRIHVNCTCPIPWPELLPWHDAYQCLQCGYQIAD